MIHLLERLLAASGLPIVVAVLLLGALPVAVGAWIRVQWRERHDVFLRVRRAQLRLALRFRRDPRTVRSLTARLRGDTGWDPGRWLVAAGLWLGVLIGWTGCALALLRGAYVRDQLERSVAGVPVPVALFVYALWCAGLVLAARIGLDRAAVRTPERPRPGLWPAVTRSLLPLFCSFGVTTLLVDRDGYPLGAALLATVLPGVGLVGFGALQDRLQTIRGVALPEWLLRLDPGLAPVPAAALVPAAPLRRLGPADFEPRRSPSGQLRRGPGGLLPLRSPAALPLGVWSAVRSRVRGMTALTARSAALAHVAGAGIEERIARARPGLVRVVGRSDAPVMSSGRGRSWAALAPRPAALGERDPRRLGPYVLQGRIGAGGMATVFLGTHRSGQEAAIKVPAHAGAVDEQTQRRLAAEIATMAPLDVAGVVRIRDAASDAALLWIAMDYLRGPTLGEAVARLGPITDRVALRALARRVARALAGLHRAGVTHRDIKPSNLILTDAGPVLVDLGIAKVADATLGLTATGTVVGSAGYLPPEAHRNQPYRHTADVWAWACCVVFAASGRPLFAGSSLHEVVYAVSHHQPDRSALAAAHAVDPQLGAVVESCIAADPRARPGDGGELLALLPPAGAWIGPDDIAARAEPASRRSTSGGVAAPSPYDVSTTSRGT